MINRIYQWLLSFFYTPPMVVVEDTITTENAVSIDAAMTAVEAARITASAETEARVKALQEENERKRIERRESMLQKVLAEIAGEAKLRHTVYEQRMHWYNQKDFPVDELVALGYDVSLTNNIYKDPMWTVSWANAYERQKLENESVTQTRK